MKRFLGVVLLLVIIINFWFGNLVEGVDNQKEKLDTNKLMQQTSNTLQENTLALLKTVKLSSSDPQKLAQLFNSDFKDNLEKYLMAVILHAASDPAFHTAFDTMLKLFTSKLSNVKTGSGNSSEDMGLIGGSLALLILLKLMPPLTV